MELLKARALDKGAYVRQRVLQVRGGDVVARRHARRSRLFGFVHDVHVCVL
jgi:hypothetical protein